VFITAIGAVTCLMRGSVGEVVAVPEEDLEGIRATATAPGSPLTSSPYRDLVAGQSTEVEHLFGDLVAVAERVGVPAPLLGLTTTALRVHQARVAG
jgi:2-dehydropantoate 2-reductase